MTPKQRCYAAIESGKVANEAEWCRQVLSSKDARATPELKAYASTRLLAGMGGNGPRDWIARLQARKAAGEVLMECQERALREVHGSKQDMQGGLDSAS